ncbi:hypothetical protein [Mycetocola zhadangensis]|uniref:hypothetical protein n=1 Tax=Mycetocola zhadangensis TaxID=1164595 RepID=UPI0016003791|nr:hypothetical protein [Mycetocola zhadangensis]GGE91304.1 hypothetical protein GCM10011313_12730 [Mycetocola zhadangensis]
MSENPQLTDDALVPRLHLIEDQPLEARADAYAQLHEELRAQLEVGDKLSARSPA